MTMSTLLTPAITRGTIIRISSGYYIVETTGQGLRADCIMARRAERPETHASQIKLADVLEVVAHAQEAQR